MREDTQKSFRDACLWVLWTLLTSRIKFFSSIFTFYLFCFLLHYTCGLALNRPGYLGIVALASCTYYGRSLKPSCNLIVGPRCTSPRYTDALSDPGSSPTLFLPRDQLKGDLRMDRLFLRWNATSRTFISVSLLILEWQSRVRFGGPFRIRMWNSAAIQSNTRL